MTDSLLDLMDGENIANQNKAIDKAILDTEQKHISWFQSQPPLLSEDEYLRLKRCVTIQSKIHGQIVAPPNTLVRDFMYGIEKSCNLPQHIINDLEEAIAQALKPFRQ